MQTDDPGLRLQRARESDARLRQYREEQDLEKRRDFWGFFYVLLVVMPAMILAATLLVIPQHIDAFSTLGLFFVGLLAFINHWVLMENRKKWDRPFYLEHRDGHELMHDTYEEMWSDLRALSVSSLETILK